MSDGASEDALRGEARGCWCVLRSQRHALRPDSRAEDTGIAENIATVLGIKEFYFILYGRVCYAAGFWG